MSLPCCLAFTAGLSAWPSERQWLLFVTSLNLQFLLAAPVLLRHRCFTSKHGKGNNHLGFFFPVELAAELHFSWDRLLSPASSPPLFLGQQGAAGGGTCYVVSQAGVGVSCSLCCSHKSWLGVQELEAIKARVREMEKEDERLKQLQLEAETRLLMSSEAGTGCSWVMLSPQGPLWGIGWQLELEHVALPLQAVLGLGM